MITMKSAQKREDYANPQSVVLELDMKTKIMEGTNIGGTDPIGGGDLP